jgi:hypothetical protein
MVKRRNNTAKDGSKKQEAQQVSLALATEFNGSSACSPTPVLPWTLDAYSSLFYRRVERWHGIINQRGSQIGP